MPLENFNPQKKEVPDNLENESEKQLDLSDFEEKVKNANPSALEKVGNALKSKGTWAGMLGVAMGAYMVDRVFNHQGEVAQNIIESITDNDGSPDPERVRHVLLAFKGFATSFFAMSGILTYMGFLDGNDPMRDYRKIREGQYIHKDTLK